MLRTMFWVIMTYCIIMFLTYDSCQQLPARTKPKRPAILRLVYFEQNSTLFLRFSMEEISKHWLDTYTVQLKQRNKPILELNSSQCVLVHFLQICECSLTDETIGKSDFDLNLTVTVSRNIKKTKTVLRARKRHSFHFYDIFCPGPIINLGVTQMNHSSVVVRFELTEATKRNVRLMSVAKKPLFHRIHLHTSDRLDKEISITTLFRKAVFQLSERPNQKIAVTFHDLSADTNYLVSVTSLGAGGESDVTHLKFTTQLSAPVRPPVLKPFSFIRVPMSSHNETCLLITWQPLPKHLHGGTNLHYKAEITALNTNVSVNRMITQHFLQEQISSDSHLVKLWAENDIRSSEQHAEILIPPYTEMKNVKLWVNYVNDTTANVYVHMASVNDIESLAVHWCHSLKSDVCKSQDVCTGILHSKQIEIPSNDHHVIHLTISFLSRCKTNVQKSNKILVYEDFEAEDGVKTITPVEANVMQTEHVLDNSENGEDVGPCSLKEKDDSHHDDPRVFFVSHKVRGTWSGMVSDVCYFDSTSERVDMVFSQTSNNDMTKVLTIQQICDADPASKQKQFLVLHYDIYSSDNGTCHMKGGRLATIENNLVSPVKFAIPNGLVYLCVVAVGQLSNYTHSQLIVNADRKWQVNISRIFIATTCVIFVCLFIALTSCCFFRKCWARKNHFEKYFKTHLPASVTNQDMDQYDIQTHQFPVYKYPENCHSSNDTNSSNILNNNSCQIFSLGRKNLAESPDTSLGFPSSSLGNYSKMNICESAEKVLFNAVFKEYNNEPDRAFHLHFDALTPHVVLDGLTFHEQFDGLTSHEQFEGLISHEQFDGLTSHEQFDGLTSHEQFEGLAFHEQFDGLTSHEQFDGLTSHEQFEGLTSHEQFEGLTSHEQFEGLTFHEQFDGLTSHEQFNGLTSHEQFEGLASHEQFNGLTFHEQFDDLTSHEQFNGLTHNVQLDGLTSHEQLEGLVSHEQFDGLTSHEQFSDLTSHEQFNGLTQNVQLDGLTSHVPLGCLSKRRQTNDIEKSVLTINGKGRHLLSQTFGAEPCITSVDSYGVLESGLQFCVPHESDFSD